MSIVRCVFDGDINCDCISTRFFEAPEAGGTPGRDAGGTQVGHRPPQPLKKLNKNPLSNPVGYLVRELNIFINTYIHTHTHTNTER